MTDGIGHGLSPRHRRRPSAALFLIATTVIVVILIGVATTILVKRREAQAIRTDTVRTSMRQLLLANTMAAVALSESAERSVRETGDPVAFARYANARGQVSRGFSGLLDIVDAQQNEAILPGVVRLRELVETRFAPSDVQFRTGSIATGEHAAALREASALSQAIDVQGDLLGEIEWQRLSADGERAEATSAEANTLFWLVAITAILAAVFSVWLWWHASSRHFELEIKAYDALNRLRAVFEGTSDAIVIFRPSGVIEEANSAAASLLGYEIDALEGLRIEQIVDIGDIPAERRAAILDGSVPTPLRFERTALDHDGNAIPVDVALGIVPFADGALIVASLRDFSERRAAERMKDDFISTISHELRTPLTSVVGALGLLREGAGGALPETARRLVDIAENNSRRLIRLVNDILDIDRLGSGRVRLDIQPIDLRAVASRARDDAEGIATPRGVRIALEAPGAPIVVAGDGERLLQVIGNLLSNAVRFSPENGTVALVLEMRGREALVRVDDVGPGVPSEFRARLFGRFTQSSAGAAIPGGTGLGLAISREIVRAHGGDIWYADRSRGARFCFSLPIDAPAAPGLARRVLLCGDDMATTALLRDLVEREGYVLDRCGSIDSVHMMARANRHDVLLLDLPRQDREVAAAIAAIRARPETRDLPVIVISAPDRDDRRDPASAALDVVDWIDRPIDRDRLLNALDIAIAHADDGRPVLLHVEDDADVREVVALALAGRGRILQAGTLASARAALAVRAPAAVILDLDLPDGSGLDLVPLLAGEAGRAIPTVVYSAGTDLPAIGGPIVAVLVKSARSPLVLSETIGAILARQG